jgi:hypothetical protein
LVVLGWVVLLLCQLLLRQSHPQRVIVILRSRWHQHGCAVNNNSDADSSSSNNNNNTNTIDNNTHLCRIHRRTTQATD